MESATASPLSGHGDSTEPSQARGECAAEDWRRRYPPMSPHCSICLWILLSSDPEKHEKFT